MFVFTFHERKGVDAWSSAGTEYWGSESFTEFRVQGRGGTCMSILVPSRLWATMTL